MDMGMYNILSITEMVGVADFGRVCILAQLS